MTDYDAIEFPPRCPQCRSIVRPDVVLFGEFLPPDKVQTLLAECRRGFDAVFSVGTTSVFPYIVEPVRQAQLRGRPTIEINPGETTIADLVDVKLAMVLLRPWTPSGHGTGSDRGGRTEFIPFRTD